MNRMISKTNADLEFLNRRVDDIQMNDLERLKVKARIAQAEAIAETLASAAHGIARMFKFLRAKSGRPAAPSAG